MTKDRFDLLRQLDPVDADGVEASLAARGLSGLGPELRAEADLGEVAAQAEIASPRHRGRPGRSWLAAAAVAAVSAGMLLAVGVGRPDQVTTIGPAVTGDVEEQPPVASTPEPPAPTIDPTEADAGDPAAETASTAATTPSSTPATSDTTGAPAEGPVCPVVVEMEEAELTGAWRVVEDEAASGGAYLTWEGLEPGRERNEPADTIALSVDIPNPGQYGFAWAVRQPEGAADDRGNDSFVDWPTAERFGPPDGGPSNPPLQIIGNTGDVFAFRATAIDEGRSYQPVVEFDRSGVHRIEVSGRSHGHQIDRVLVFPIELTRFEAERALDRCTG
ncbi:MAG: hypothetical protein AAGE88_05500 [Actinomycetota bacterium]